MTYQPSPRRSVGVDSIVSRGDHVPPTPSPSSSVSVRRSEPAAAPPRVSTRRRRTVWSRRLSRLPRSPQGRRCSSTTRTATSRRPHAGPRQHCTVYTDKQLILISDDQSDGAASASTGAPRTARSAACASSPRARAGVAGHARRQICVTDVPEASGSSTGSGRCDGSKKICVNAQNWCNIVGNWSSNTLHQPPKSVNGWRTCRTTPTRRAARRLQRGLGPRLLSAG